MEVATRNAYMREYMRVRNGTRLKPCPVCETPTPCSYRACSAACRVELRARELRSVCEWCEAPFVAAVRGTRFCSRTCFQTFRAKAGKWGLSAAEGRRLLAIPVCEACGIAFDSDGLGSRRHIDHNHKTGVVRGVLCHRCNVALGHLRDDRDRIFGLLSYVASWV